MFQQIRAFTTAHVHGTAFGVVPPSTSDQLGCIVRVQHSAWIPKVHVHFLSLGCKITGGGDMVSIGRVGSSQGAFWLAIHD